jgi:uncharacterized membrane protein
VHKHKHKPCNYLKCFSFSLISEDLTASSSSTGAFYDPALFGIMGGLALMFIVMCVVLQLFAK